MVGSPGPLCSITTLPFLTLQVRPLPNSRPSRSLNSVSTVERSHLNNSVSRMRQVHTPTPTSAGGGASYILPAHACISPTKYSHPVEPQAQIHDPTRVSPTHPTMTSQVLGLNTAIARRTKRIRFVLQNLLPLLPVGAFNRLLASKRTGPFLKVLRAAGLAVLGPPEPYPDTGVSISAVSRQKSKADDSVALSPNLDLFTQWSTSVVPEVAVTLRVCVYQLRIM